MASLTNSLLKSTARLRGLVISYWLLTSFALVFCLGGIDLFERHRELLDDADHTREFVASTFSTPLNPASRQSLISAYSNRERVNEVEGLNMLLVIDSTGRIVYSSNPAVLGLSITDPQLQRTETSDPNFNAIVSCFRNSKKNCIDTSTSNASLRFSSFTVTSPLRLPPSDIGMPAKSLLVISNYDPGVIFVDYQQDLFIILSLSALFSGIISFWLWTVLYRRLLPQLSEDVNLDGLTQLFNRSLFMEKAKELLAEAEISNGDFVFAVIDIDHFKRINDTYGHAAGDIALFHVADVFRAVTRPDDLVCRLGGEEFALLLGANRENGERVLERLRLQLEMTRLKVGGQKIKITASIGAAFTGQNGYNIDYLYNVADKALYVAKESGRNRLEWSGARLEARIFH